MRFVADTHCLVWYFLNSPRLSPSSKSLFDVTEGNRRVVVPTIVLSELLYLSRKVKLPTSFEKTLGFLESEERFEIHPLSLEIVRASIPLKDLDLHDALIVATARHLGVPLMTNDQEIIASGLIETLRP